MSSGSLSPVSRARSVGSSGLSSALRSTKEKLLPKFLRGVGNWGSPSTASTRFSPISVGSPDKPRKFVFHGKAPQLRTANLLPVKSPAVSLEDSQLLNSSGTVAKTVLFAYFRKLKRKNERRCLADMTAPRVKLAGQRLTLGVFSQGKEDCIHSATNPFKYDILLFPVFSANWTLLRVNLREKTVAFFDPVGRKTTLSAILSLLCRYLASELQYYENSELGELRFQSTPDGDQCRALDSGLWVCREAFAVATGKAPPPCAHFRQKLKKTLRNELLE